MKPKEGGSDVSAIYGRAGRTTAPARLHAGHHDTERDLAQNHQAFFDRHETAMKKLGLASENGEIRSDFANIIHKPGMERAMHSLTDPAKQAAQIARGFLDRDGKVTKSAMSILKMPTLFACLYGDRASDDLKLLGLQA
ncbi:hypothetical protein [Martelella sp. HB161492]|uniref:hypothetical protein n=1 Tax=Martelella sp. HB161492 TaxID=2720726 RepID=UPI00158FFC42|nr:hypothetical protein [Martelella sp. HB161492]